MASLASDFFQYPVFHEIVDQGRGGIEVDFQQSSDAFYTGDRGVIEVLDQRLCIAPPANTEVRQYLFLQPGFQLQNIPEHLD